MNEEGYVRRLMLGNQGNDGNEEAESVTKKKTALFFTP
jgi:hypothetical protein